MTEDTWPLLDEVRAIARTGLHYTRDPFDRERYERLLELAAREYAGRTGLTVDDVTARFQAEVGYVTARVGVDAAIFDEHDRLLLVRRADDDKWGLVAGWVDTHEAPDAAAVREVREEAGLDCRVDRLVGVFYREARADEHPHGSVSVVYLCTVTGGTLRAQPHEVRELAWRAVDEVDPATWHHHHELLARAALDAHWRTNAGI
jgi:ADP-ribose pyrophosphatase YjhB (NUDIX family)